MVLAAGGGVRLGSPKALLRRDGELLVERAVATAREAGCAPVVVVLGASADQVIEQARLDDATVVVNKAWATGMGSSLRTGLQALDGSGADAAVVLLVDMPGITAQAIRRVAALPYPGALVVATYEGRRGHPILIGSGHWSGVATLARSDVGARPYLLAHKGEVMEVGCDGVADNGDIDTPEDAVRWGVEIPGEVATQATLES
ncbi:MAG TPA: nucleotidyltransferase family protein [Micromonosporaceae bacterium]|nr:nucleotidyltransferase family protein [Micromonosporaceae bacterium]